MKWVIRLLGVLVVLVVVLIGALLLMPSDRIARVAADQIEAQTGRKLTVTGGLKLSFWPVLGVETGPVALANADWAGSEPMFRADGLSIGVGARELIAGQVRVTQIVAEAPVLNLRVAGDGRVNWDFSAGGAAATTPAPTATASVASTPITLEKLRLRKAQVRYEVDGAAPLAVNDVDLTLDWPDAAGPADLSAKLAYQAASLALTARIEAMADFLDGKVVPLSAKVEGAGSQLGFDGRASIAGEATGHLTARSGDTAAFLTALGIRGGELPNGLGRAAEVETDATYTADGRLALRDLAVTLDQNRISGAADLDLGATPPRVTANLTAGALDLSGVTEGGSSGSGSAPASSGWSKAPIDASALGLLDGQIRLSAQSIDTGSLRFGPTEAEVTIDRSRAVLQLAPASIFDGSLSGQLVANNRNGLSVAGNLKLENINTTAMLREMAGTDRLSGTLQAQVEFLGVGNSVDAIMHSLSGKGSQSMGRGVISGIDLDRLFRSGVVTGGTTVFDSLSATYTISGGNLQNDDFLLSLPHFKVSGAGRIGLGDQDLDYLVTPRAFGSDEASGLQVPVRLTGPWANPKIRPDLDAATKAKLEEKQDALEEKAKEKLREKLNLSDGQDTEDALKDKLEEEAKKGLLKLLGRD